METKAYTFIELLKAGVAFCGRERGLATRVVIPIIQRDYAQGREDRDSARVREKFLDALYEAVTSTPVTLDFIYGNTEKILADGYPAETVMTPLDGQQRLTTLFLLHWYAAKKEGVPEEEYGFLKGFSYETRYSTREFCAGLIDFTPAFQGPVSREITDEPWFALDWLKDESIRSMLVMLDAIQERFAGVSGSVSVWKRLKEGAVTFYFLPLEDMGLTDELYIKMNSRGKPLTLFEHFKAELERKMEAVDRTTGRPVLPQEAFRRIVRKIDGDWTDMFWADFRDNSPEKIIDDAFIRYFRFICLLLCYGEEDTTVDKSGDVFELLERYFTMPAGGDVEMDGEASSSGRNLPGERLEFLESCFDIWNFGEPDDWKNTDDFFRSFVSNSHEAGKIMLDGETNLLKDCLLHRENVFQGGKSDFPLRKIVLLYAFIVYLRDRQARLEASGGEDRQEEREQERQFRRRLRIVNNLVRNSEDELRDSGRQPGANRMPVILRQTERIILAGVLTTDETGFNADQLQEEREKEGWRRKVAWNVSEPGWLIEALDRLEDHPLLEGRIAVVGLEKLERFRLFEELFSCDWDLVDRALMATGFYMVKESRNRKYRAGSSKIREAWRKIFHAGKGDDAGKTGAVLRNLLDALYRVHPEEDRKVEDADLRKIADTYLAACETGNRHTYRYYYVKYPFFRPGRYGLYQREDHGGLNVLVAEFQKSENAYDPFLYAIAPKRLSRAEFGKFLNVDGGKISSAADAYVFTDGSTGEEIKEKRFAIPQNPDGSDAVDRIQEFRKHYKKLYGTSEEWTDEHKD